ncbi:YhcG family protein [Altericista sp. CCNU0014]|uniref:PDDEXK nuclease domain-containing protein n=1 Tax=Altericista sp. CCNU0014 TaxID=3082949 RepID=UPI00384A8B3F
MNTPLSPELFESIRNTIALARAKAQQSINFIMVEAYWQVGQLIVENEQQGDPRAAYGTALIQSLSDRLTEEFGKGFSERNLRSMRNFYLAFPIQQTLSAKLSWSHYVLLLKVEDAAARHWYIQESAAANWSVRALERQIDSHYYERLLLSQDKQAVIDEANQNTQTLKYGPKDFVKDPYVLEFLNLKQSDRLYESTLEQAIITDIQQFLLELGRGFAFVDRQQRISVEDDHFYIDLVFYNYLLKCFVIIDLKTGKLTHQDVGQMDMYVRLYDETRKSDDDNPTVGIILCSDKNETIVKYSSINNQTLFAAKYKLYLPSEQELKAELASLQNAITPQISNEEP